MWPRFSITTCDTFFPMNADVLLRCQLQKEKRKSTFLEPKTGVYILLSKLLKSSEEHQAGKEQVWRREAVTAFSCHAESTNTTRLIPKSHFTECSVIPCMRYDGVILAGRWRWRWEERGVKQGRTLHAIFSQRGTNYEMKSCFLWGGSSDIRGLVPLDPTCTHLLVCFGLLLNVLLNVFYKLLQFSHELHVTAGQLLRRALEHVPHRSKRPEMKGGRPSDARPSRPFEEFFYCLLIK